MNNTRKMELLLDELRKTSPEELCLIAAWNIMAMSTLKALLSLPDEIVAPLICHGIAMSGLDPDTCKKAIEATYQMTERLAATVTEEERRKRDSIRKN